MFGPFQMIKRARKLRESPFQVAVCALQIRGDSGGSEGVIPILDGLVHPSVGLHAVF
jgi:hypothetical protein